MMKQLSLVLWLLGWPLSLELSTLINYHVGRPYTEINSAGAFVILGIWVVGAMIVHDYN